MGHKIFYWDDGRRDSMRDIHLLLQPHKQQAELKTSTTKITKLGTCVCDIQTKISFPATLRSVRSVVRQY